jgi:flagella basal body P-ring formation protein FlgA
MIFPVLLSLAFQPDVCHPVHSDRIYARDLAQASPAFAVLPPDLPIGFSPVPGMRRVIPAVELRRIAAANGITPTSSLAPVCFAWPVALPSRQALLEAMQKALAARHPKIEILEQTQALAPPGKIVFPLSGLSAFSDGPVVWRGYVEYAPAHRFPLWARVLIRVQENHIITNESVHAGERLRAAQLRLEHYEGPPTLDPPVASLQEAVGMVARFEIRAGTVLTNRLLEAPKEVERGDTVSVLVKMPGASIEAAGVAEQSGTRGSLILVRNAKSGKKFRAVVEDQDKVFVIPQPPVGLTAGGLTP